MKGERLTVGRKALFNINLMKRALIFDLDNTIYPVSSIADSLFKELFVLLDAKTPHLSNADKEAAKDQIKRRPFHLVAEEFGFSDQLTQQGNDMIRNFTYDGLIHAFDDYHSLRTIPLDKYLVTTGFTNLQWSKVKKMDLEKDFIEIHIVDPEKSTLTKKDVFADIIKRHDYTIEEVLVIGDDPLSEIKAANELGIDTFLFDPDGRHPDALVTHRSGSLKHVLALLP